MRIIAGKNRGRKLIDCSNLKLLKTPANQLLQTNSRHFDFEDRSVYGHTREPKKQNNAELGSKSYDLQGSSVSEVPILLPLLNNREYVVSLSLSIQFYHSYSQLQKDW